MILIGSVGVGGRRGDKGLYRMKRDLCNPNRECGNSRRERGQGALQERGISVILIGSVRIGGRRGDKGLHRM